MPAYWQILQGADVAIGLYHLGRGKRVNFMEPIDILYTQWPQLRWLIFRWLSATVTGKPLMLSTGMSTNKKLRMRCPGKERIVRIILVIAHSTSAYPASRKELNLRMIPKRWVKNTGAPSVLQAMRQVWRPRGCRLVRFKANLVERPFYAWCAMWGSAPCRIGEPQGLQRTRVRRHQGRRNSAGEMALNKGYESR